MTQYLQLADNYIRKYMTSLDDKLDGFVTDVCRDRDETHGRNHMWKISRLAIYIAINEGYTKKKFLEDVLITSWLHDVADHKYSENTNLETLLENFLESFEKGKLYKNIIDRISYSKEVKYGTSDWKNIMGIDGLLVRNIVSDADKIDALGENGIRRCIEFGFHKYSDASDKEMIKRVRDHAEEKLLLLKDKFIRTKTGKELATPEHQIMLEILFRLDEFFIENYRK
jgi:HD superfamily phosphodiesterase